MNGIGANMVRVGYAQNNSFRQRSPMYVATSVSDLNFRETEIVNRIQNKLSSLGSSLKFDVGHNSVSLTMFIGDKTDNPPPFVLSRQVLAEMAEDKNVYREWMSKIQEMVSQQSGNQFSASGQGEVENYLAERNVERRSQQIRANMMSVLDFWNENRNEGRSWLQATQGKAVQQIANRYEQMLSGQ